MKYENISESLYIKGRIGWKGLKKGEYLKTGDYRIINGSNISNGVIDWSNCGYITKQRYFESPEIMLKKGDILITKDGTIGKVAIVNKLEYPSTIASGLFILRNNAPEKWNTLFLYYYLQTNRFKEFVHSRTEGSVIPHLYQKDFENLEIPYISLTEQYKISSKLDLIQRKISLNRQINDNLLELVDTLFDNIIKCSILYKATLNDIGTIAGGGTPSKKVNVYWNGKIPWLTPKDLSKSHSIFTSKGTRFITEYGLKESSARLFPTGTVLFSSRAPIGYISIAKNNISTSQGFKSIIPNKGYSPEFIYELLKKETPLIIREANGSTFKEISGTRLKAHIVNIPSKEKAKYFDNSALAIFKLISKNENENKILKNLKKELLNKIF